MPRPRRQVDAGRAVEQNLVVEQDAAFLGPHEAGDGIQNQGLARPARAEQHGHSGPRLEFNLKRESGRVASLGKALGEASLQHYMACLGASRLARYRIASATADTTRTSTRASAPLPLSTAS